MQFYKIDLWVVFIKLGQKHASKDGIELAVFKAFWDVLSFGLGVVERVLVHLLTVLLADGLSFVHSVVYSVHKQAHNQDTENKDLSLSSNREHIRYGVQSNIFGWILNGMTTTRLRKVWYSFGLIRVCLVHEIISQKGV